MLVTGGAGFIGTNFVRHTLAHHPGYRIRVLDKLTYAGHRSVAEDVEFVHGDVCDAELVERLVADSDIVVHFAAESHVDNSLRDADAFVHSNIVGTYALLQAVRRHDVRLHHISTDEVFGDLPLEGSELFHEGTPYNPSSPYAATKAASDMLVRAWVRSYGVAATLSNCANNYGPYQHVEKFIPRQVTNIIEGRRPRLYGQGVNVREWTHVDDHNRALHLILDGGRIGETYLIGSGDTRTNREVIELVNQLMGRDPDDFEHVRDRAGHDLRYANDSTKLRSELGWAPEYADFRAGLAATIDWYRSNRDWWQQDKISTEAGYALVDQ
ncbi:dTDP-glucose 4,6-dehydratase [Micromonospora echinofusca]|uniref:dTDP-glucose 4,6-dehydratase n=1 Tax=Micromonospora echinofusca TaxID=47858 RepID=UPI0020206E07|nr:dTDP-glucose 4,6-dehydratase [Micromonospora sp. MSM11]MCL7459630.1 dTDP-glucose 4,6-dehydratase [Micromonospora sp. MSM11]